MSLARALELDEAEDLDLHRAFVAGDKEAGGKLIDRHYESVYAFFLRRMPRAAEDLLQRVFEIYVRRKAEISTENIKAFLLGVAYRQFLKELARVSKRRYAELPSMSLAESVVGAAGVSTLVSTRSAVRHFIKALQTLPNQQQTLIEMLLFEGVRMQDAATVIGVPLNTCKGWRRKAIASLREALRQSPASPRQMVLAMAELKLIKASGVQELLGLNDGEELADDEG